jgi:CubicO group peptidase (beta-lactamase class C family)
VTKSVVSTLVGIALGRSELSSLDDEVSVYLGDAARAGLTLRHLLTMTVGAETGGAWDIDAVMSRPSGWVDWILAAPRRHDPGARFVYDNGAAHVLGAALAAATGAPLSAYAEATLFRPLGIAEYRWPRDPDGRDYGFGHLRLRPRDLAAIGQLYLGRGESRGRRVVSEAFVEEATRPQTPAGPPEGTAYGFLWWVADEPVPHAFAAGYAGQSLTVVPELGLVVVTTGDESRLGPGWRSARHALLDALV